jgi:hypothetical protein
VGETFPESNLKPLMLIPLTVVIAFAGGVFWFASLYAQTNDNARTLNTLQGRQEKYYEKIQEISERLTRIEAQLARHNR